MADENNGKNGKVGLVDRVKEDIQAMKVDIPAKAKDQIEGLKDPTKTQVYTSIFRHKHDDTPRNRALGVLSNVFLHLHPAKINRDAVRYNYTWGMGGITFYLFIVLTLTGALLMFYYHPTKVQAPCPKCKGEGLLLRDRTVEAKVPAGVEDGTRIRFSGLGEAGAFGGPAGDLYIVLHVKEHAFFEREGNDLHCVVPISFPQAALGTEIMVPMLEGEHRLKVPEGTQSGTSFRIRSKGVPVLNGHGKGDLYVEVRIQTPGKLGKRQRELLAELGQLSPVENKPQSRSLLGRVKDMFA